MSLKVGLDTGTNSIGWVLVDESKRKGKILESGVRIFSPPVDAKTKTPHNQERRNARSVRRNLERRKRRNAKLLNLLIKNGFLPSSPGARQKLFHRVDPYSLRADGLDRPLEPFEVGQAIYHLAARRGFKSNRKEGKAEDSESKKVSTGINQLKEEMADAGSRTLGEFLYHQPKKRERYTERAMHEEEFNVLWDRQAKHHKKLTPELKNIIFQTIFLQRPLKGQKGLVGLCAHEKKVVNTPDGPKTKGKKRCAWSHPLAQRYRFLQDINNLAVNYRAITEEERRKLIKKLENSKSISMGGIRKLLGLKKNAPINLEASKKTLKGAATNYDLKKALGKTWERLDDGTKDEIYIALATIEHHGGLIKRLTEGLGLSGEEAEKLSQIELEAGYCSLSLYALKKIVPYMEEGRTYDKAVEEAGYHFSKKYEGSEEKLPAPPVIRNPVVQKALVEMRKVVNSIIRKYGRPDIIRIEFARELKQPRKVRERIEKEQRQREEENNKIEKTLRDDFHIPRPSRNDILKYRLWEESERKCPYTGKTISQAMLYGGDVDIEHILPWPRSMDNSYMNKTLCLSEENRKVKHNKTPWEAYSDKPEKWDLIRQNLNSMSSMPEAKKRKFFMKEIPADFTHRHLNDTRYIAREARAYLGTVCEKVETTSGSLTAMLRRMWGLNGIINANGGADVKDRQDHRHHTTDALVTALTTPSAIKSLARASVTDGLIRFPDFPEPWKGFREEAEKKIKEAVVSHAPTRKLSGPFHEMTFYGPTLEDGVYAYRKPVENLTAGEVERIRDERIRELIEERVERDGLAKAKKSDFFLPNKNGEPVPVKTVRLLTKKLSPRSVKHLDEKKAVLYGENHHVEIFRNLKTGKYECRFVTGMEAAERVRRHNRPMVDRQYGKDYTFVTWLAKNDTVEVTLNGAPELFRVQKMTPGTITLRPLHSAKNAGKDERYPTDPLGPVRKTPQKLIESGFQKVNVSPIGEVYPAND